MILLVVIFFNCLNSNKDNQPDKDYTCRFGAFTAYELGRIRNDSEKMNEGLIWLVVCPRLKEENHK